MLLKENLLFSGQSGFLHLFMCVMKTHSEKVTKSIWNYVEMYAKERRGIGMEDIGIKTYIHWNRPPLNLTESLDFERKPVDITCVNPKW